MKDSQRKAIHAKKKILYILQKKYTETDNWNDIRAEDSVPKPDPYGLASNPTSPTAHLHRWIKREIKETPVDIFKVQQREYGSIGGDKMRDPTNIKNRDILKRKYEL